MSLKEKKFLITKTDGNGDEFWSNDHGWTDQAEATRFTQGERDTLRMPVGTPCHWIEEV